MIREDVEDAIRYAIAAALYEVCTRPSGRRARMLSARELGGLAHAYGPGAVGPAAWAYVKALSKAEKAEE